MTVQFPKGLVLAILQYIDGCLDDDFLFVISKCIVMLLTCVIVVYNDLHTRIYNVIGSVRDSILKNRTVEQLPLTGSHPPRGCRSFIACTNLRYAFWITVNL